MFPLTTVSVLVTVCKVSGNAHGCKVKGADTIECYYAIYIIILYYIYILLYYTIYIDYYIILLCLCRSLLITSMGHIKLTDFGLSKVGLINSK